MSFQLLGSSPMSSRTGTWHRKKRKFWRRERERERKKNDNKKGSRRKDGQLDLLIMHRSFSLRPKLRRRRRKRYSEWRTPPCTIGNDDIRDKDERTCLYIHCAHQAIGAEFVRHHLRNRFINGGLNANRIELEPIQMPSCLPWPGHRHHTTLRHEKCITEKLANMYRMDLYFGNLGLHLGQI